LRSLTPAAAIAWAAYVGWLHLPRSLAWMGTLTAVVIFSALALFELINDKRPTTAARTAPPGLVARVVLGAFGGTCVAAALGDGVGVGLALGTVGALAGTFGGYQARTGLVKAIGTRDLYIALLEDCVTIAASSDPLKTLFLETREPQPNTTYIDQRRDRALLLGSRVPESRFPPAHSEHRPSVL
jgi:uncharacterized membrane protein